MNSLHSLRTAWRSEWQMPQKRISTCTSRSVRSRRGIDVETSGEVAPAAGNVFDLYMQLCSYRNIYNLKSTVRGPGKRLIVFDLLQAGLQGRRDHREGVAARVKLFRRVRHAGDLDEG